MKKFILILIVIISGAGIWWWQQEQKKLITLKECSNQGGTQYHSYPACPENTNYLGRITELKGSDWSCCSNDSACTNYFLDETHKIINESRQPQGKNSDPRSPNDNSKLERIIIDPDDKDEMDEPWRHALYSQSENIFWVRDMPGFEASWYGPYEGYPCLK